MKHTSLYNAHVKLGGKIIEYAGFELPVQYEGITKEHEQVRKAVGLFDVSHMGEVRVTGEKAESFLDYLCTNRVKDMAIGKVIYSVMLKEHGGVVDDLLVYRLGVMEFLLVVNAANTEKDFAHIKEVGADYKVSIVNESEEFAQIAIQGPHSEELLKGLVDVDIEEIGFYCFQTPVTLFGAKVILSRTGYTGEDGFEVYCSPTEAETIWSGLLQHGEDIGVSVKCIGLGARDTLRFEAGLPLYGHEISEEITPLEAKLSFFVKMDKDFLGKEALEEQKKMGLNKQLIRLDILGKPIAREGYKVLNTGGEEIGHITTGYYLPNNGLNIAMALIDKVYCEPDTQVLVQVRKKQVEAKVRKSAFMKKNYKK